MQFHPVELLSIEQVYFKHTEKGEEVIKHKFIFGETVTTQDAYLFTSPEGDTRVISLLLHQSCER